MSVEFLIFKGDLVYYIGPPILSPLDWSSITQNDNGIISSEDLGVVIQADSLLRIANVFFQKNQLTINRISFKRLKIAE